MQTSMNNGGVAVLEPDTPRLPVTHIAGQTFARHVVMFGGGLAVRDARRELLVERVSQGAAVLSLSDCAAPEVTEEMYRASISSRREKEFFALHFGKPAQYFSEGIPARLGAYNPVREGSPAEIAMRLLSALPQDLSLEGQSGVFLFERGIEAVVPALRALGVTYSPRELLAAVGAAHELDILEAKLARARLRSARTFVRHYRALRAKSDETAVKACDELAEKLTAITLLGLPGGAAHTEINVYDILRAGYCLCVTGDGSSASESLLRILEREIATTVASLAKAGIAQPITGLVSPASYSVIARHGIHATLMQATRANIGYLLPLGTATHMKALIDQGLPSPAPLSATVVASRTARGATGSGMEDRGSPLADRIGLPASLSVERLVVLRSNELLVSTEGGSPFVVSASRAIRSCD